MPPECPPHSAVTIHQLDEDTWLIKKQPAHQKNADLIPPMEQLPDDPEWETVK